MTDITRRLDEGSEAEAVRLVFDDALRVLRLRRARHDLSVNRSTAAERLAAEHAVNEASDRMLRDVDELLARYVAEGAEAATSGSARAPGGLTSPAVTSSPADASAESGGGSPPEPSCDGYEARPQP